MKKTLFYILGLLCIINNVTYAQDSFSNLSESDWKYLNEYVPSPVAYIFGAEEKGYSCVLVKLTASNDCIVTVYDKKGKEVCNAIDFNNQIKRENATDGSTIYSISPVPLYHVDMAGYNYNVSFYPKNDRKKGISFKLKEVSKMENPLYVKYIDHKNQEAALMAQQKAEKEAAIKAKAKSYTFTQEEPGKILNYVPIADIENVDSLTIVGLLDERDFKIINKMVNLTYLDLSNTYITYDPDHKKDIEEDRQARAILFNLLDQGIDEKRKNGELDDLSYAYNKTLTEMMVKSTEINPQKDPCIMPAVKNLTRLRTAKLPLYAETIEYGGFLNCSSLTNVEWPICLKSIGKGCFANTKIKNVNFTSSFRRLNVDEGPENLYAFQNTPIEIFDFSKCENLKQILIGFLLKRENNYPSNPLLPNLKEIYCSPKWNKVEALQAKQSITYYIPIQLEELIIRTAYFKGIGEKNPTIYFQTPIPPKKVIMSDNIANDGTTNSKVKVYIPKGSLNDFYMAFDGNSNIEFIEY